MTTTDTVKMLVKAMRATSIAAPQARGLWYIQRQEMPESLRRLGGFAQYPDLPLSLTSLCRWTDATLHLGAGESVMSDEPTELLKHIPVVLAAHGRVLVSGLGLGCVVRGLLARPQVTHVDVVEIDRDVLAMMAPAFEGHPRLTMHHGDAATIAWTRGTRWDFAWHDVWSETPSTQVVHGRLLVRYAPIVGQQGAWNFPRLLKRRWPRPLLGGPARRQRTREDSRREVAL